MVDIVTKRKATAARKRAQERQNERRREARKPSTKPLGYVVYRGWRHSLVFAVYRVTRHQLVGEVVTPTRSWEATEKRIQRAKVVQWCATKAKAMRLAKGLDKLTNENNLAVAKVNEEHFAARKRLIGPVVKVPPELEP